MRWKSIQPGVSLSITGCFDYYKENQIKGFQQRSDHALRTMDRYLENAPTLGRKYILIKTKTKTNIIIMFTQFVLFIL